MLDFSQVAAQMAAFAKEEVTSGAILAEARQEAARRLRSASPGWADVQGKIDSSKTSWLMPSWRERPDQTVPAPAMPESFTVLATDGSQIVADRHDLALCFLINIGYVALRYGQQPSATLRSHAKLATPDASLLSDAASDQDPIAPKRLSMHCRMQEIAGLAESILKENSGGSAAIPSVALCDGSLILWPLITESDGEYRRQILTMFQANLDAAREHGVPVAGYISRPMSKDVVNSLRVAVCPYEIANCDLKCRARNAPGLEYVAPPCGGTERVTDADLFGRVLRNGERSAIFYSGSKILCDQHYEQRHRIAFFYLHVGREVARVEIPAWVAEDAVLVDRVHALCLDQARKGDGYPVAISEAHEQAIVRGSDRAAFFHLMERHFVPEGIPVGTTQKALSKRARRV